MQKGKWIERVCSSPACGKSFMMRKCYAEHKSRFSKSGKEYYVYCSLECRNNSNGLSVFKDYVRKAKWATQCRHRNLRSEKKLGARRPMNITAEYLQQVRNQQKGICPYTGVDTEMFRERDRVGRDLRINYASLDRIDSTKGYEEGNVEFVCMGINYMKNRFTKAEVLAFLRVMRVPPVEVAV